MISNAVVKINDIELGEFIGEEEEIEKIVSGKKTKGLMKAILDPHYQAFYYGFVPCHSGKMKYCHGGYMFPEVWDEQIDRLSGQEKAQAIVNLMERERERIKRIRIPLDKGV